MIRTYREAARERAMLKGKHLEQAIRVRMPAAGIRSIAALARQSGVQRDTLYAWFRGDQPPKPATLQKVADALGVRLGELWDYEQHPDGPPGTLNPEWLAEVRAAVAEGVELGVARALERLGREPPPPRPPRSRR